MASCESEEDVKGLDKREIGSVEEVRLGQSMLQAESILEAQFSFCSAEIGYHLCRCQHLCARCQLYL